MITKTKKKTPAIDLAALEAERAQMLADLEDLRRQETDAKVDVEQAEEDALDLLGRLHRGDDTVTADDLARADAEKLRAQTILNGMAYRAKSLASKIERFTVPKTAILLADLLNADPIAGLIEWHPATSREDAGRKIREHRKTGSERVGVVIEESVAQLPGSPSVTSGMVTLSAHHDPLTRRLTDAEVVKALTATGRVRSVKPDSVVAGSGAEVSGHRLRVDACWVDETPVVNPARIKYQGPDSRRLPQVVVDVETATITEPTPDTDGTEAVSVTATLRVRHPEGYDVTGGPLQAFLAAVESEDDKAAPAVGPMGRCVRSVVKGTRPGGARGTVVLVDVEQDFVYRLAE